MLFFSLRKLRQVFFISYHAGLTVDRIITIRLPNNGLMKYLLENSEGLLLFGLASLLFQAQPIGFHCSGLN
jgi:hypothetical protein